jgi:SAM-dependent methyltransferase
MTERTADAANAVVQLFDAKAATWPAKYAPEGRLAQRLALFGSAIGSHIAPGGHVLDLGCGTGELARHLAASGRHVTGCDISPAMLRQAAEADPASGVSWIRLPPGWKALPFPAEAFDAIVASSVLEYVSDPSAVLRECARVLRPGGSVLCTVPDARHPIRWLEWLFARVARAPTARTTALPARRLRTYVIYLRLSRHRHALRWWRAASAEWNLHVLNDLHRITKPSPLRMLTFQRSTNSVEQNL